MKRFVYVVVLLVSIALLLTACAPKPAATQAPAQPASSSDKPLYVFLPKGLDNPYWDNCRKGMES